jgi:hypothetical protein
MKELASCGSPEAVESIQLADQSVPTDAILVHQPSLTLANESVSYGWQATRRLSTEARSAKVYGQLPTTKIILQSAGSSVREWFSDELKRAVVDRVRDEDLILLAECSDEDE